jgi:NAD(P)-dependent dehydrogenase (short-subunit alcohol dehydrogenase family)
MILTGAATARRAAAEGARVLLADRRGGDAEALAAEPATAFATACASSAARRCSA